MLDFGPVTLGTSSTTGAFKTRRTYSPYMWLDYPRRLFYIVNSILNNLPLSPTYNYLISYCAY
jgi:hypothetical protein